MNDLLHVRFNAVEGAGHHLQSQANEMEMLLQRLRQSSIELTSDGFGGYLADTFSRKADELLYRGYQIQNELSDKGIGLVWLAQMARELDVEAIRRFEARLSDQWSLLDFLKASTGSPSTPHSRWNSAANSPFALADGAYMEMKQRISNFENPLPEGHSLSDYASLEANLLSARERAEISAWGGSARIGGLDVTADLFGADAEISGELSTSSKGLKAQTGAAASVYALRMQVSGEVAGVDVVVDGLAGARASGKVQAEFNPFTGNINAGAGVNAFAGAEATIQGATDLRALGLQGVEAKGTASFMAGAGVVATGNIGIDDGKFSIDLDLGLALGVGARASVDVEVDVWQLISDLSVILD